MKMFTINLVSFNVFSQPDTRELIADDEHYAPSVEKFPNIERACLKKSHEMCAAEVRYS